MSARFWVSLDKGSWAPFCDTMALKLVISWNRHAATIYIRTRLPPSKIQDFVPSRSIKVGTQSGTQKCAERAVEAVDAVHAVRILLSKFSAC